MILTKQRVLQLHCYYTHREDLLTQWSECMKWIAYETAIFHNPSIHNVTGDRKTQEIINGLTFEHVVFTKT